METRILLTISSQTSDNATLPRKRARLESLLQKIMLAAPTSARPYGRFISSKIGAVCLKAGYVYHVFNLQSSSAQLQGSHTKTVRLALEHRMDMSARIPYDPTLSRKKSRDVDEHFTYQ
jgi:hypothetical protein